MQLIKLENEKNTIWINTNGAQILSWINNNQNIFVESNNYKRSGMPIMFPFCGPLENNSLSGNNFTIPQHGFGRSSEFAFHPIDQNTVKLTLNSQNLSAEIKNAFPYNFIVDVIIELIENGFEIAIQITNLGDIPIPCSPGLHPYFYIEKSKKDLIKLPEITNFDSLLLPWSTGVEAQFYANPGITTLQTPNYNVRITDQSTITNQHDILSSRPAKLMTVWAGEVGDWVCIEPMENRFNSINDTSAEMWKIKTFKYKFEVA